MIQSFSAQRASYRQGLVLGLTMAEVMLLMVFTLLLVAGSLLEKSHARIKEMAEQEASTSEARLAEIESLREELSRARNIRLPDNWRELVRIDEALKQFQDKPVDGRTVLDTLEIAEAARRTLRALGYKIADIRQIPDTILKNMPPAVQQQPAPPSETAGHNWPPIIRLSEADNYFFELGKAEITPEFRDQLVQVIVPRILELIRAYDVDVIEVIGHTDEVAIANRASNLDARLIDTLQGRAQPDQLTFSDNAGLAMARASAVARVLMDDDRLKPFRILPLSAAQVITTEEKISEGGLRHEMPTRRRIEIRVRRTSVVQ